MPDSKPPASPKPTPPARGPASSGRRAPLALPQAMGQAMAAYRAGRPAEAERLCRRVLKAKPDFFDALNLLGAIAAQSGRAREAVTLFGRAIAANPANPQTHLNRGIVQAGLGRFGDALASFEGAITARPDFAAAHDNRGNALMELGRLDEALASYDRAVELAPRAAAAHGNRGVALRRLGRLDEALASFDRAIAINPDDAELHGNRGNALREVGRLNEALASYDRALALDPRDAAAHASRGVVLRDLRRPEEALAAYDRAIALDPRDAAAHNNRGNALMDLRRLDEALAGFDRALALRPENAETCSNRGVVLRLLERPDEARAAFERALEINPDHVDARWNLTVMQLLAGDFGRGWEGYLRRAPVRGLPQWVSRDRLHAAVSGERVLVLGEQGLGDEIFFLRFVAALKRQGAWIAYRGDPRLARMLERLPFLDRICASDETPEALDRCFTAGDLPFILGVTSVTDIPPPIRLTVDDSDRAAAGRRLRALGPPPYIGVTWRAGPGERGTLSKAAPPERLGAALRPVPGTAVVVQRHPDPADVALLERGLGRPSHDLSALNDDLDGILALMDALDDYVCVSNTNVHLRTACGHACRVLVPNPPEFRWMAAGDESPWFPGTRLYRESPARGWDDAFGRLAAELTARYPAA